MSEEQATSLRKQIDDKVIDARNEVIMQATNAFLLGRQVVLVSLGLAALTVEQSHALLQQAVARGEVVERDAQQMFEESAASTGRRDDCATFVGTGRAAQQGARGEHCLQSAGCAGPKRGGRNALGVDACA